VLLCVNSAVPRWLSDVVPTHPAPGRLPVPQAVRRAKDAARARHGIPAANVQRLIKDAVVPSRDAFQGLLGLVEMGVVELHPWTARIDEVEHPDMMVFDLDRLAAEFAALDPRYTITASRALRAGKLSVDNLRNGRGQIRLPRASAGRRSRASCRPTPTPPPGCPPVSAGADGAARDFAAAAA
jgi:hypothetical protein